MSNFQWTRQGGGTIITGYGLPDGIDLARLPRQEVERLTTPGVDGARFRKVRKQWPLLDIQTLIPCATLAAVYAMEDTLQAIEGTVGKLVLTLDTLARTWPVCTMVTVATRRSGKFVGAVATDYSITLTCQIQRQSDGV